MLALVPQVMKQAMDRYEDMFVQRGSAYDRAMRRLPQARAAEFAQVIARADMRSGQVVADVPAGGGYLRGFLPAGVAWVGHEPCASFQGGQHGASSSGRPLLPFPWEDASKDRVICLAGLHHQEDKIPFHSEARRVLRPSGRYVLSDVPADSPVAAFLDGFIARIIPRVTRAPTSTGGRSRSCRRPACGSFRTSSCGSSGFSVTSANSASSAMASSTSAPPRLGPSQRPRRSSSGSKSSLKAWAYAGN